MSNEEEKRCPLCAEEMDWTDQQFKPCQCGYQVCVWCWHHIMDMAEKDQTEGRCPACRVIYEKEKIVAMQANSERMLMKSSNNNKKCKPPKAKPKAPEVKKDLTNIRVIQRKMAYVIGLPLSLANEDLLQRKEYFGQYGKISKMSLSRSAGGAVQHFINESCSVYVTYSREEEALRCIQSVHGFVLEGRFLRASFGTAKYCHAWLKSMPCNNPACLYLHNVGAEEDSFGKDEIAAIHTRNRVQQIVGAGNNMLRRIGSILPPPVDVLSNSSSAMDRSTAKGPLTDSSYGSHSNGEFPVPNKVTTFVDIVGRSSSPGLEKEGSCAEDGTITNLCSEFSSINIDNKDYQLEDLYTNSMPYEVSSSTHLVNRLSLDADPEEFSDEPFRDDFTALHSLLSEDIGSLNQRVAFQRSPYPSQGASEDSGDDSLMHRRNHSSSYYNADQTSLHSLEDEAFLPMTCVNSVLNEGSHELKFQNSAKSDMIYRNSNSFSNEEIVEHLRRVDSDILTNNGLLDENGDQRGSSWNSYSIQKSGFSFPKEDGFVNHVANFEPSFNNLGQMPNDFYVLNNYGVNNEHYLSKPQYQALKSPSMAPPGFSVPPREGPPGFSTYEQAGRFPRNPSGNLVSNSSSLNSILQEPPRGSSSSCGDVDFLDHAILNSEKGKPTNVLNISGMGPRCVSKPELSSAFDDDASRLWLLMQQQHPTTAEQNSNSSQIYVQQQTTPTMHKESSRYSGHHPLSLLDNLYGYSSKRLDQCHQKYETSSNNNNNNTLLSHQKLLGNGHNNSNGYHHQYNSSGLDEEVVHRRNEIGISEIQRSERLGGGLNKYFSGYGDLMFSSMSNSGGGDVYSKVYGMQL